MKFYNIMRASISITVEYHYATKRIQMIIELLVSFVGERFFYSSFKLIRILHEAMECRNARGLDCFGQYHKRLKSIRRDQGSKWSRIHGR